MTNSDNVLPIPLDEIKKSGKAVDTLLAQISFTPAMVKERVTGADPALAEAYTKYMQVSGKNTGNKVSIIEALSRFSDSANLLSVHASYIGNTVKYGYALGLTVAGMYAKGSGLSSLRDLNEANRLQTQQISEFQQKLRTEAAIELFCSAYYIVWQLSKYHSEESSRRVLPKISLPEFKIENGVQAFQFSLFYYAKFMESETIVSDDVALIKFTSDYFTAILNELDLFKASLEYVDEFESRHYKLDDTGFVIRGFNPEIREGIQSVEFKRTSFDEIVGNRDSKHAARRLIQSLMCYDANEKKNPMLELGGIRTVSMGYGPPGTGKSMLIAAIATELSDRCKELGIPFYYHPFPPNPVSEYQGGSSERVLAWFRPMKDPGAIFYCPVDDAENNLVSRGNKSISSGNREVISIFLTETEGAGAVLRGNYAIQLFTNRPEDLDAAVLSRIQARAVIAGAETWEDFVDQEFLWFKKYKEFDGFINMEDPDKYEYLENQKKLPSLSILYKKGEEVIPKNDILKNIFLKVSKEYNPLRKNKFFGIFYQQVKEKFPFITSRDIRNIQSAVSERIMDFDFPEEWMRDNSIFFAQNYAVKKKMLIELMKQNMGSLSFGQIRLQEAIKYLDVTVAINETKFETAVKEQVEEMKIFKVAKKRFDKIDFEEEKGTPMEKEK